MASTSSIVYRQSIRTHAYCTTALRQSGSTRGWPQLRDNTTTMLLKVTRTTALQKHSFLSIRYTDVTQGRVHDRFQRLEEDTLIGRGDIAPVTRLLRRPGRNHERLQSWSSALRGPLNMLKNRDRRVYIELCRLHPMLRTMPSFILSSIAVLRGSFSSNLYIL